MNLPPFSFREGEASAGGRDAVTLAWAGQIAGGDLHRATHSNFPC